MNCHEFETNLIELVKEESVEPTRRAALAHASSCEGCGVLLEGQRRLSAELHSLAATQSDYEAPPGFELRLVAAFREHSAGLGASTFSPEPFAPEKRASSVPRQARPLTWKWQLWGTVAAGLVLGVLVLHSLLRRPDAVPVRLPQAQSAAQVNPERGSRDKEAAPSAEAHTLKAAPQRVPVSRRIPGRTQKALRPAIRSIERPEIIEAEVATDFYPIPYAEPALPGESMRIVRTRVPRSSLAAFGFALGNERAFDTVQADVLVGEDNMARAIRFVQQWQLPRTASRPAPVNTNYVR